MTLNMPKKKRKAHSESGWAVIWTGKDQRICISVEDQMYIFAEEEEANKECEEWKRISGQSQYSVVRVLITEVVK